MIIRNIKKNLGFTLIEIMVSLTIVGLLTALFLANYRTGGVKTDLTGSAQKLASNIRLAQNFSLGTKEFNGITPTGGWGIYFDTNTSTVYTIFADMNGDYSYGGTDEFYSSVNLPARVSVDTLIEAGNSVDSLSITFLPPDPKTYINGTTESNARIGLKEDFNNTTKFIDVNFLGLIDVIN